MQTELELPEQATPTGDDFPTKPRGVRKWLEELAHVDMREATRRVNEAVYSLNRLEIPPKRRLDIMEMLAPTGREVLDHLASRIQAQMLPLPERTRKVFQLDIELLAEFAVGYEAALVELTGSHGPGSSGIVAHAAERSLTARGEIMLRSAQVYSPVPDGFWQHTHTVFARTEAAGAVDRSLPDPQAQTARRPRQTPRTMYKRLLMFALAQTEGLLKAETERVYTALETWAPEAQMRVPDREREGIPSAADADCRFAVELAGSAPPRSWRLHPGGDWASMRVLDLGQVVGRIESQLEERLALERSDERPDPERISSTALRRLLENWQQRAVRRSQRERHGQPVDVEVTLPRIHHRLREPAKANEPDPSEQPEVADTTGLSLEAIDREEQSLEEQGFITHPGYAQDQQADELWDDIGRGRTRAKGYVEAQKRQKEPSDAGPDQVHWMLDDSSHHGFRLHWVGEGSSRATVGELIAFSFADASTRLPRWRIGVVRWIQFVGEADFMAGCAALSTHMAPASVRHARTKRKRQGRKSPNTSASPALMMRGNRAKGYAAGLITPAHVFDEGEVVQLEVRDRRLRLQLGPVREHSGSFTHFEVAPAHRNTSAEALPASGERSVWESI